MNNRNKCNLDGDTILHESGLRTIHQDNPTMGMVHVTVNLPSCCPISGNPQKGSTLRLSYRQTGVVLETYSLDSVVKSFKGGFKGVGGYPEERNMEGMICLLCKMASDALGTRVRAYADLILDTGPMVFTTASGEDSMDGYGGWVEAFRIFQKYENMATLHPGRDAVWMGPDPKEVKGEDRETLRELGWIADERRARFMKFV